MENLGSVTEIAVPLPVADHSFSATLVIAHLGLGGAERIIALLANHWARKGWRITLMTLDHGNEAHFYPIDPAVKHVDFGWSRVWKSAIPKLRMPCTLLALRAALRRTKPNVIVSFLDTTNVSVLMASFGMGIPVIVSERNDPHYEAVSTSWDRLRRWFYPAAACVVAQTQRALDYFSLRVRERGCVIPNPVLLPNAIDRSGRKSEGDHMRCGVIAVGRLSEQKGFDLLLTAFAQIAPDNPDWSLTIWGEGNERRRLEAMVRNLGLDERVDLPGKTQRIFEHLPRADLFVLSSRYEGFPNALCEAMACGVPAISFDCPSGPNEIIRDGIDGILVPAGNVDALAYAMQRLMNDRTLRASLSIRAPEVLERFNAERIFARWEQVVHSCVKGR